MPREARSFARVYSMFWVVGWVVKAWKRRARAAVWVIVE